VTGRARQAPPRARPSSPRQPRLSASVRRLRTGWLLELIGNGQPREMVVPAIPAGTEFGLRPAPLFHSTNQMIMSHKCSLRAVHACRYTNDTPQQHS